MGEKLSKNEHFSNKKGLIINNKIKITRNDLKNTLEFLHPDPFLEVESPDLIRSHLFEFILLIISQLSYNMISKGEYLYYFTKNGPAKFNLSSKCETDLKFCSFTSSYKNIQSIHKKDNIFIIFHDGIDSSLQFFKEEDSENFKVLSELHFPNETNNFVTGSETPLGYLLFLGKNGKKSYIVNFSKCEIFQELDIGSSVNHISISKNGTVALFTTDSRKSHLYQLRDTKYELLCILNSGDYGCSISRFSNHFAVVNSENYSYDIYKVGENVDLISISNINVYYTPLIFSPMENNILVCFLGKKFCEEIDLFLINIDDLTFQTIELNALRIISMCFSERGDELFVSYLDQYNKRLIKGFYYKKGNYRKNIHKIPYDINFSFK